MVCICVLRQSARDEEKNIICTNSQEYICYVMLPKLHTDKKGTKALHWNEKNSFLNSRCCCYYFFYAVNCSLLLLLLSIIFHLLNKKYEMKKKFVKFLNMDIRKISHII